MIENAIYVMTHKKCNPPGDPLYRVLHVGRANAADLGYAGDDTGDNISDLNDLFGELTGFYWIWKNTGKTGFVGVCHYRRYFINAQKQFLAEKEFAEILENYDVITSDRKELDGTYRDEYAEAHNLADLLAVGDSIRKLYPEYVPEFEKLLDGSWKYYGNLTVMSGERFDAYCDWLFSILFDAAERIDVSGYDLYHRRVYGFLSEGLLQVWIAHHHLKAFECPIGYTSEKAETTELKTVLGSLVKEKNYSKARELFYQITKIRPDIQLPASDLRGELPLIEQILWLLEKEQQNGWCDLGKISDELPKLLAFYRPIREAVLRTAQGQDTEEDRNLIENSGMSEFTLEMIRNINR